MRVHNFNFDEGVLTIDDGKGKKDRAVPLPDTKEKKRYHIHETDIDLSRVKTRMGDFVTSQLSDAVNIEQRNRNKFLPALFQKRVEPDLPKNNIGLLGSDPEVNR